jgi:ATP-dependent exoDNAse (exonuclease V) alpha subunit
MMEKLGTHVPVVASTGAAAVLVGGQTFHRFFGLDGARDVESLVTKALSKEYVWRRISEVDQIILDEVSMLPGYAFEAAYQIAKRVRRSSEPWGGMGVIAVGDFRQLPPVVKQYKGPRPWSFLTEAWKNTEFVPAMLTEPVRATDKDFCAVLNDARIGMLTDRIQAFLDEKTVGQIETDIPRVFAKKVDVESFNNRKLAELKGSLVTRPTEYFGHDRYTDELRKHAPVPEQLAFRRGALVMMRQNSKDDSYVNGSLGHVVDFVGGSSDPGIVVKLIAGSTITVSPSKFMLSDEFGEILATCENYPMTLAWATTIHKSQGATMDAALLDLAGLWEPGQLYVAVSRVRSPEGVKVIKWDPKAFLKDRKVSKFHQELLKQIQEEDVDV